VSYEYIDRLCTSWNFYGNATQNHVVGRKRVDYGSCFLVVSEVARAARDSFKIQVRLLGLD
jgi:hypothetical protein